MHVHVLAVCSYVSVDLATLESNVRLSPTTNSRLESGWTVGSLTLRRTDEVGMR